MARAKRRVQFVCDDCGAVAAKWQGRCGACGAWNTLREFALRADPAGPWSSGEPGVPLPLTQVEAQPAPRRSTGIAEFDRVLGGGIVSGAVLLLGGEPGIGKSTLLMQTSKEYGERWGAVLYVSGEESAHQIRLRAERLGCLSEQTLVVSETDLDAICRQIDAVRPELIIVDSVQTVASSHLEALPGSVSQVREAAVRLQGVAKERGIPLILVGHVTKDGGLAGPKVLEHLVDVVLQFDGDRHTHYRLLRSAKNRFGTTNELGIFEMGERGLEPVADPSRALLAERPQGTPGSVVTASREGSRALLVEIQALVGPTPFGGTPRRQVSGVDQARANIVVAVLERRLGLHLHDQDIYLNVAGGLQLAEPAVDLAMAAAIASSFRNVPVGDDVVVLGEVGLAGEVRAVDRAETRLEEAARLGFRRAVVPRGNVVAGKHSWALDVTPAGTLSEALQALFEGESRRPAVVST